MRRSGKAKVARAGGKPSVDTKGKAVRKRSLFAEIIEGVEAMKAHREGRITLRTYERPAVPLPAIEGDDIRATREALRMSRGVFARKLHVNPRTLERWEQGRSTPNEQAIALLLLVRNFPDTLERLDRIAAGA